MPLYEYLCGTCGHRFERIQKFSDPLVTECPTCGGKVEKQVSSPAIQFKGKGWYVTDYAKSGSGGKDASKGDSAMKTPSNPSDAGGTAKSDNASSSDTAAPAPATPAPAKPETK